MSEVRPSPDYARVVALPRRAVSVDDGRIWSSLLTPRYRLSGYQCELRPWQALAIAEAIENNGAWLALPVGIGKTLIAELLPRALDSRRAVLLLPASLREKTYADRKALLADGWSLANPPPRMISFTELALEKSNALLDQLQPDLIIIDEAHTLANGASAAAKRVDRYVLANPGVRVVPMTGTPSRNSIMGYWHLICWALRERAPVPMRESEARRWAGAIDNTAQRGPRVKPGVLGPTVQSARSWFARRLAETPGVLIVDEDSCDQPLTVRVRKARECPRLDAAFRTFLETLETPDGLPVSDPLSRWRLDGQLGCGLYLRWNPQPPEDWRTARRAFARFVRTEIQRAGMRGGKHLDTEAQVVRAFPDAAPVVAWRAIRDTFDERTEAVWISDATLRSAQSWLTEDSAPGLVWCGCVEFARELARRTGLPYYASRGADERTGKRLHAADERHSMVVSWSANMLGFNLQAWTRQLIIMPPQSAKYLEQMFGRSHRAGQDSPVTIDILATSGGTLDMFDRSCSEADFARRTVRLTQKLLRAKIELPPTAKVSGPSAYRWARKQV